MKTKLLIACLLFSSVLFAQNFVANYDETKVPVYSLPDPLVFNNGKAIQSKNDWADRRKELYSMFEKEMYGKVPEGHAEISFLELSRDEHSCNGMAVRREIRLNLSRNGKNVSLNLLLFLPKSANKVPLFLGYNFNGNHTVTRTNTVFPHWFCNNFKRYNNKESSLPFDQHELLALVAPRPLYVLTAEEDRWGDPKGSFLACVAASPVYQLLGQKGFPGKEMPSLNQQVIGTIGFHIRPGKHDQSPYDWNCFMDFAKIIFDK